MSFTRVSRSSLVLSILLALMAMPAVSRSQPHEWTGISGGLWADTSNWTNSPPPITQPWVEKVDVVNHAPATNTCFLHSPSQPAHIDNVVEIGSDPGMGIQTLRVDATTLEVSAYTLVRDGGHLLAFGGSVIDGDVFIVHDVQTGRTGTCTLSDAQITGVTLNEGEITASAATFGSYQGNDVIENAYPGTLTLPCDSGTTHVLGGLENDGDNNPNTLNDGVITVHQGATLHVAGNFNQDGVYQTGEPCGTSELGALVVSGTLALSVGASTMVRHGGTIECGSFDCATMDVAHAPPGSGGVLELEDAVLRLAGGGGAVRTMECVSPDLGPSIGPDDAVNLIGELHVLSSPAPLSVMDQHDNTGSGAPEAIYVRDLILEDGITIDLNGATVYYGNVVPEDPYAAGHDITIQGGVLMQYTTTTGVAGDAATSVATAARLHQASPNPFNPLTTIAFDSPTQGAHAELRVYDASGRFVRSLVDGFVSGGRHEVAWDGRGEGGAAARSGVYFYTLAVGGDTSTRRMTLIR